MSLTPTTYSLMNYRPSAVSSAPVASGVVSDSVEHLLEAIRDEAADLKKNWHAPTPPAFSLPDLGQLLLRLLHPGAPATPTPVTPTKPTPVGGHEPETRVVAENPYSLNKNSAAQAELRAEGKKQHARNKHAIGRQMGPGGNFGDTHRRIREIAATSASEKAVSGAAFTHGKGGWVGPEIKNPNAANGKFDPYTYQPEWIFDTKEDSLPVRPDFDGSGKTGASDLKAYKHGVVGGKQPLEGAFTVTKRGEYTVLTYSLNYVDNKFTNYHVGDSSTASVYLKPNKAGKLEPAYLYTSIHYAGKMMPWKDVKKDAEGRPIIRVERGSHAIHPYGVNEKVTDVGLRITGDGQAMAHGKALPNRMTWLSSQKNVQSTVNLDPAKAANRVVWGRYFGGYPERAKPYHPSFFKY